MENSDRKNSIPILYVKGNYYECGIEMGRTFASLIHSFISTSKLLNEHLLPVYNSSKGREVFDSTLKVVNERFPQYVSEIKGIADGAKVDFYKLMLFHFDEIIPNITEQKNSEFESSGCSTIYLKNSTLNILAHTEDAASECLNNFYIVSAHVISNEKREEKYTALCYPGHIGGYTMGYNNYGLVFSINTLVAKKLLPNKTPRHFITRALLGARNYDEAIQILKDNGVGLADGFSINIAFLRKNLTNFFNIEMGPAYENNESQTNIKEIVGDDNFIHCNHYLRMNVEQHADYYMKGTKARYETLSKFPPPISKIDVINMLGDTSHKEHCVFRSKPELTTKTICVGIFDFIERTWSLYKENPKLDDTPLIILKF
ncbi:hypothetical protein PVAND_010233 [Polypedilum vanderplanki]|uniref:Peptidase C45 hydrolase domain-containing protein n=1 Tax=Polypedilum vanderplanki TaxID=319348 RepID=A0A9J6CG20_POLVA|nr:hypothetical protein PVAND_010233 [Polypedilum vanderplanki]